MKLKPVLLTLGSLICLATSSFAQGDSAEAKPKRVRPPYEPNKWPSISLGVGHFAFNGDVGKNLKVVDFSNFRMTYRLDIEQRFYSAFGVSLTGMYGKMARNERSTSRNLNFENTVMQGELNVILYLDNNLFINRSSKFSPYLYGGVGYMMFTQKTDSLDKNGEAYNYWTDGSIRTRPQTQEVIQAGGNSYFTQLDRKYETSVKVSTPNALVFPMGLGLRYKLSNLFYANIQAAYYMTMSDLIDNVKDGGNDSYVYVGTSFTYNIGMKGVKKEPTEFDDVDFASFDKEDDDGDGVNNNIDECGATPEGTKVNEKGCPLDEDKDGVPDYMDDEKGTKEGVVVDAKGVTIPEEGPGLSKDSIATDHTRMKEIFPTMKDEMVGTYYSFDKPQKVSASSSGSGNTLTDFKFVDTNGDGYISSDEISSAIDAFFEGESQLKSSDINRLIDFFFEQ
jgi:hypothetical protein